ncbi:uncharacterized protein LOC132703698 [Cylas formicarius]|uniref:uncharacterized protein LOC132703698 n=1 Tax=Cylas formicarius TaxID=197179 RepID=UPI0029587021|nr:uncharacterized protein LOC132703698 [Cylas formicarius]
MDCSELEIDGDDHVFEIIQSDDAFNEEKFLKMICDYPCIYDSSNKANSSRLIREKAFQTIATSMDSSVLFCKKKWKSLREKYHREKNKADTRSKFGLDDGDISEWPLMHYFYSMFDKIPPRQIGPGSHVENAFDEIESECRSNQNRRRKSICPASPTSSGASSPVMATGKRKHNRADPFLEILNKISASIEDVSGNGVKPDKISYFGQYVCSEIRDLPANEVDEFMDDTITRLLQMKRKCKSQTGTTKQKS